MFNYDRYLTVAMLCKGKPFKGKNRHRHTLDDVQITHLMRSAASAVVRLRRIKTDLKRRSKAIGEHLPYSMMAELDVVIDSVDYVWRMLFESQTQDKKATVPK